MEEIGPASDARPGVVSCRGSAEHILSVIQASFSDPSMSLRGLSLAVHLSERQIRRIVRCTTGMTFRRYLRSLRIARAAELLSRQDYSVKSIAWAVGYTHPSYFSHDFKSVMTASPLAYRENTRVSHGAAERTAASDAK
jgi:two-component system response regulator YesN